MTRMLAIALTTVVLGAPAALAQAPGPESFAKEPQTPLEYWDAVDYLVRTGQPAAAVPYLDAFLKGKPDDVTLLQIRDRYGAGSILRLEDYPQTRSRVRPLLDLFNGATRRHATDPNRIRRAIEALSKTRAEQAYGVERLRLAGPYAVPALVKTIEDANLPLETRRLIVANMGRLDRSAVPALVAVLDGPDRILASSAADALAGIGDPRAVPFLTYPAAQATENPLRDASRRAIARLTGRDFAAQPKAPIRLLTDEARKYHLHQVAFPSDDVEVWSWQDGAPSPRSVSKSEAEAILGMRFAREALNLDPTDRRAQVAFLSLALEKAQERAGFDRFPNTDPTGAFPTALAAGPGILGDVVRQAIADGHSDLAAIASLALGRVADRDTQVDTSRSPSPLIEALSAPDRRVRFAAARALVDLAPPKTFPGASRVVPTLASFVASQSAPKVIIIDGDINRANGVGGTFRKLGHDFAAVREGDAGFRLAADSADIEAVLIEPTFIQGPWRLVDILTNLRADARTAGLPIFLYGPERLQDRLLRPLSDYSRIAFLVTPSDPNAFKPVWDRELGRMGIRPLSQAEREGYARAAASLLARIASSPGSPYEANVSEAEPALTHALNNPPTSLAASTALGDVPGLASQRGLADAVIDSSRPMEIRLSAANQLSRSLQRFGRLVTSDQETKLVASLDGATEPALRSALSEVVGALRPESLPIGLRLRSFSPPGSVSVPSPSPEGRPTPEPSPAPETEPAPPAPKPETAPDAAPPGGVPEPKDNP